MSQRSGEEGPQSGRKGLCRQWGAFGLLFIVAGLGGCSDSTSPLLPADIEVSASTTTLPALGATAQLTATVRSGDGSIMPESRVEWSSETPHIVQVDSLGVVTAAGPGTGVVTATSPPASESIQITVDQVPTGLVVTAGAAQEGVVGQALPAPLVFRVTDAGGSAISGLEVAVAVTSGGGSIPATVLATDAGGYFETIWTLGSRTDEDQELQAVAGTLQAAVTAVPLAGPPETVEFLDGDGQSGLSGEPLADSLAVLVRDGFENPVPGVTVTWIMRSGTGTFDPAESTTDDSGVARTAWFPGVGDNDADAIVDGINPVAFSSHGLPNGVIEGTVSLVSAALAPPPPGILANGFTSSADGRQFGSLGAVSGAVRVLEPNSLVEGDLVPAAALAEVLPERVPGEWTVGLREGLPGGVTPLPAPGALSVAGAISLGSEIRTIVSSMVPVQGGRATLTSVSPVIRTAGIRIREGDDEESVVQALLEDPRVEWVEPVRYFFSDAMPIPAAPAPHATSTVVTSALTGGQFYPRQSWHYGMSGFDRAWEITEGAGSVLVAVVDDGIRFDHVSFQNGQLTQDGYDFVREPDQVLPYCAGGTISNTGDGDGWDDDPTIPASYSFNQNDQCFVTNNTGGHGLHVAGTIAAMGAGVVGGAPGVRVRPVRVLGTAGFGTGTDVAAGILYAAGLPVQDEMGGVIQAPSGADIINLSLGSPIQDAAVKAAVEAASQAGSLIIGAAGNNNTSSPYYPAAHDGVMAVSAVGPDFLKAPYSNWGDHIDITAPGGNVDFYGFSRGGIWSTYWDFSTDDSLIAVLQGTSMAAPHVSAVAALILSQNPGMSASQLRQQLHSTSVSLGSPHLFGAGITNAFMGLTNGQGFPSTLRTVLFDAQTGLRLAEQVPQADQAFRFSGLGNGEYLVYSGLDDRDDGVTGRPGFPWGALGGSATPAAIEIDGHGVTNGDHTIGLPVESEPNDMTSQANALPVGGYLYGTLSSPGDQDNFRVRIGEAGTYTFETGGVYGLCGFGLEADTMLDLFDESGTLLASNVDIDESTERYCSRITIPLDPGDHVLRVRGFGGGTGNYSVRVH